MSDLPTEEANEKLDLLSTVTFMQFVHICSVDSDTELNPSGKKAKKQTAKKSTAGQKKK